MSDQPAVPPGPDRAGAWVQPQVPATEVPLHPSLPAAGRSPGDPHHQPHAASAGPAEQGARGALWFVLTMVVLIVLCGVGVIAILVAG